MDEGEAAEKFEDHLLADYDYAVENLQEVVLRPLHTFQELQSTLRIRTQQGKLVQPKIFPNRHLYLEQPKLTHLKQWVSHVGVQTFA